jgi:two-component system heavy metal sensor histidine kinase CusS
MKAPSFRLKIALLSTGIAGVVLAGFGVSAFVMIARQKTAGLDTEIRALGTRHPGWFTNRRDFQRLDDNLGFIFGEDHRQQVILMVKDAKDRAVLYTSPGWPQDLPPAQFDDILSDEPTPTPQRAEERAESGSGGGRGWGGPGRGLGPGGGGGGGGGGGQAAFTTPPTFRTVRTSCGQWRLGTLGSTTTSLTIGLNTDRTRAELDHLRNGFLLALALALALVGLGGWLVAGRALRPIRVIARTAEQVTARGLDQRIPVSDADPEIARVIHVLNRMMDRLESSFHQATRFSADASHELNTPLAIMQGELENALQEARPDSTEQRTFSNLLEETQRLKTITRGLLLLARADAGQLQPTLQAVDLTTTLERMLEDLQVLAAETAPDFEVALASGVLIEADPSLLHTALLNLLVNAVKYNQPGGSIRVHLEAPDHEALLTIGNSGPGIPEADQARVFTRFHRVDAARQRQVEGIGLGLSLAREIVRAHGGELTLQESRPGWTSFMLRLQRKT